MTEWGWQTDPKGLRYVLNEIYGRYRLPIMVVENGLGAYDKIEDDGSIRMTIVLRICGSILSR